MHVTEISKGDTVEITRGRNRGRKTTVYDVVGGRVILSGEHLFPRDYSPRSLRPVATDMPAAPAEKPQEAPELSVGTRVKHVTGNVVWEILEPPQDGYVRVVQADLRGINTVDYDPASWFPVERVRPVTNMVWQVEIVATPGEIWEYEGRDLATVDPQGVKLRGIHEGRPHRITLEGPMPDGYVLPVPDAEVPNVSEPEVHLRAGDIVEGFLPGYRHTVYWRYRVAIHGGGVHLKSVDLAEADRVRNS